MFISDKNARQTSNTEKTNCVKNVTKYKYLQPQLTNQTYIYKTLSAD